LSENTEEKLLMKHLKEQEKFQDKKPLKRQNSSQGKVTFVIKFDPRLPQI